ncbi:MAG: cobalamin-binding protein [Gammaproteobacteria bacterium]|nr:cobalamin-binding protein [Gammaproteobacteria bacterium]
MSSPLIRFKNAPKLTQFLKAIILRPHWLISVVFAGILSMNTAYSNEETPAYQRIISLAPHITEMLYSAGAGDKIVGVVSYSDYPKAALKLPIIGGYNAINLEAIIQLNPDLILGWTSGNRLKDIERLKALGFHVQTSDVSQLEDIPNEIAYLGSLTHTQKQADKVANQLRHEISALRKQYQNTTPVSGFYEIWHQPLITMNGKQFISQALNVCGATNIFADLASLTAEVGLESLFKRNPQMLLLGGKPEFQKDWMAYWQQYTSLKAVKHKQIYALNSSHLQRPSARMIYALKGLCQTVDKARQHYQAQAAK